MKPSARGPERPIRVVHVTTGGRIGGAERLLIDVATAGRQMRWVDPSVIVLGTGDELAPELASRSIPAIALGASDPLTLPVATARVARRLRSSPCDIVHAHLIHGAAFGLLAARLARIRPAVMTRHYERYVWAYGSPLERFLHRLGQRLADHIFAISAAARAVLVEQEHVDPSRVTVVRNGIDVERVRQAALDGGQPRWPDDGLLTIGSVGSLHERKGHEDLIRAVARMRWRDRVRVILVGDGPQRGALASLASSLGIGGRVAFLGYEPAPYGLVQRFDVYAQPSREEGFGIAVLEAMSLERPVVATAVGGLPEIVSRPEVGVLTPAGDVAALGRALDDLLDDPARRGALGAQARAHVSREFTAMRTAREYQRAYADLIARRISS